MFFMNPKLLVSLLFVLFTVGNAGASTPSKDDTKGSAYYVNEDLAKLLRSNMEAFIKLTPKKYEELTGKQLTFKEVVKLKAAQKAVKAEMKKEDDGLTKGVYILLAILGLAWIAMGVKDDWKGNSWVVNLLLTVLCWLPGFVHALVKMKDYYKD